jgi:hypothetical protein
LFCLFFSIMLRDSMKQAKEKLFETEVAVGRKLHHFCHT